MDSGTRARGWEGGRDNGDTQCKSDGGYRSCFGCGGNGQTKENGRACPLVQLHCRVNQPRLIRKGMKRGTGRKTF